MTGKDNEPLEIERKYLIRYPDPDMLAQICRKHADLCQIYLKSEPGLSRRIRRMDSLEGTEYWYNEKTRLSDTTRIERERRISEEEYLHFSEEADDQSHIIRKTRYYLYYGKYCFEIDLHPEWTDRAVMEVELEDENAAIDFPPCIEIIREITYDRRYTNASLAKYGFVYEEI